ncbi:MAG: M20/M25/M40 family metallo-hydrolase [Bacteroidia bacterium]|nr:M20/M25/M40 family metallo-hydrolase [Bacteroidia bacterium]
MRRFSFLILCLYTLQTLVAQDKKETKSTTRFKEDISYLASDQLEGRLTGSMGELKSSLYISDEFKENKLSPMGDSGTYLQGFNIVKLRINQSKAYFSWIVNGNMIMTLRSNTNDFYPLAQSCNKDSVKDAFVYQAGFGINAPELGHNDYKDTSSIRGKVFVIQIGSPEPNTPHGKFEPYENLNYKVDQAIKMGARGVVFVLADTNFEAPKGLLDRNIRARSIPVVFVSKQVQSILAAEKVSFEVDILQINSTAHNVIGYINNKKGSTIVIGAHQDHLGHNEYGGSRDDKASGGIHNGADDNASGVAMMLELMRTIKGDKKLKKHNYLFIAFSGEEQGLLGSDYFVKHPTINMDQVSYMLNFDMVGRLDSVKKTLMIYGIGTSPIWKPAIAKLKHDTAEIKIKTTESGTGASDHTKFYYDSIPVLHFFTGQHYDYHTPTDDEFKINYHGMYQVYLITMQMIKSVNKAKVYPFTSTKSEESEKMSFKVTLGIMPDYVFDGIGVKADGVSPDKPAFNAGILKGDIIVKLGAYTITSMQDYMKALGQFSKGESTTIVVKRNGQELTLNITF